MTTISDHTPGVALINIFTVQPDRQKKLVAVLEKATEATMRNMPGFVSANLHASLDGKKVANYAQWRSKADFEAMMANPAVREHMEQATSLADKIEPTLYEVASVFEAQSTAKPSSKPH